MKRPGARANAGTNAPPAFHRLVYAMVRRIPKGKVATYGMVARFVGHPRSARAVGTALRSLPDGLVDVVPWQRVLSASGACSHRDDFWGGVQRDLLEQEGVGFDARGRVDLATAGWPGPRGARAARASARTAKRAGTRRR